MKYIIEPTAIDNVVAIAKENGWTVVEQRKASPKSLTVTEAARRFGVHIDTMRRWVDTGQVASFRTPGGHRRIPEDAVPSIMQA